jgi:uncharacterized membrane-anchored protein
VIAIGVALAAMLVTVVPPLWVRATGSEVTLAIRPVDPLSLFRGNYVDLRYDYEVPEDALRLDGAIYAVFADERPGRLLRITQERPRVADGEFCVRGELSSGFLSFPQLEQFFVTAERGRELERELTSLLAEAKVTGGCRAVLVDLVPR